LLAGVAAAYLAQDCRLLSDAGRLPLWSSSDDMQKLLFVLQTHNKLGDMSFSAAGLDYGMARIVLQLLQTISEISSLWRLKCYLS